MLDNEALQRRRPSLLHTFRRKWISETSARLASLKPSSFLSFHWQCLKSRIYFGEKQQFNRNAGSVRTFFLLLECECKWNAAQQYIKVWSRAEKNNYVHHHVDMKSSGFITCSGKQRWFLSVASCLGVSPSVLLYRRERRKNSRWIGRATHLMTMTIRIHLSSQALKEYKIPQLSK